MREIKFRAWNKLTEQMVTDEHVMIDTDGSIEVGGYSTIDDEGGAIEVMQFTGLIDANSKEVYEDDILKITNPMTKTSVIKRVWWNGETARFNGIPTSLVNVYEVIGNVWEDPELIKKEGE